MAGRKGQKAWTRKTFLTYDDLRDVSKTWLLQRMRSDKTADDVKDKVAIAVVSKDIPQTHKHEGTVNINYTELSQLAFERINAIGK